jgi:hypothetical protein
MLTSFSKWHPHYKRAGGDSGNIITPHELGHIYNNSKFVVVGRGRVSLDCFRAYEAVIAGAIPVIAGHPREIEYVFGFNGHPAPFLFARDWDEALKMCMSMSDEEIDRRREKLAAWYVDIIGRLKRLAYAAINITLPSPVEYCCDQKSVLRLS